MDEKILSMLAEIQNSIIGTNNRLDKMDNRLDKMEIDIHSVKNELADVKLTIENKLNKNIQLLAEGYTPITKNLETLLDDVNVIKTDVDIVKAVVTTHSKQLKSS